MASANEALIKLLSAMGGRQKTVDAINEVKDLARDETGAVTLRQLNGWVYAESVPALARFYLLAAAVHLGFSPSIAVTLFPELEPTARIIQAVLGDDDLEDEDEAQAA
jgi:hypothetical protein